MTFYILYILIIVFFILLSKDKSITSTHYATIINSLIIMIIVCITIFRYNIGWDYTNYYRMIQNTEVHNIGKLERFSQIFFNISMYFRYTPLVFILFGIPTLFFIFFILKKYSIDFGLSILFFLPFIYLDTLNYMRQALAMSMAFFGYKYIVEKKYIKYIIILIIASLFHISVLVAIIIYPLYHYIKLWMVLLTMPLILIFKNFILNSFFSYNTAYIYYLDKLENFTGGSLVKLVFIGIYISLFIIVLIRRRKLSDVEKRLFVIIAPMVIFPFILGSQLGLRVSSYFYVYLSLLIPMVLQKSIQYSKSIYALGFVLYFLAMIYIGSKNEEKSLYTPYQTIFEIGDNSTYNN